MSNDDERDYDEEQYNRWLAADTSEDPEGEDGEPVVISGRAIHRAEALRLAGLADRSDPEFATGPGLAAVTHAVLALSADREPDGTWRQRAVEAEAALTAIGGILREIPLPGKPLDRLDRIEHVLRTSGRKADKLMARYRPDTPEGAAWKEGYKTAVRNLQDTQ